MRASISKRRR
jgi:hypothetical protein